jgi:salicylate hydroxylase
MVAGPCLAEITAWDKVALIGDASHPLSGAFGSGAAFAMEDGWILARALEREYLRNRDGDRAATVRNGLRIFQAIRGPYYERMCVDPCPPKPAPFSLHEETNQFFFLFFLLGMTSSLVGRNTPREREKRMTSTLEALSRRG